MTVNFFNMTYVTYEGELPPRLPPGIITTNEYCVGFVYSDKHQLAFPVFIYDCLHEYEKDWI